MLGETGASAAELTSRITAEGDTTEIDVVEADREIEMIAVRLTMIDEEITKIVEEDMIEDMTVAMIVATAVEEAMIVDMIVVMTEVIAVAAMTVAIAAVTEEEIEHWIVENAVPNAPSEETGVTEETIVVQTIAEVRDLLLPRLLAMKTVDAANPSHDRFVKAQ